MSKQPPRKFTEQAQRAIIHAQEEAKRLGEGNISTEHLLLGLVADLRNSASRLLAKKGVDCERVRREVEQFVTLGIELPTDRDLLLTPRAERVVDIAFEEAALFGSEFIGPEHILIALIREGEGISGRVLAKLGFELDATRALVADTPAIEDVESAPMTVASKNVNDLLAKIRASIESSDDERNAPATTLLVILNERAGDAIKLLDRSFVAVDDFTSEIARAIDVVSVSQNRGNAPSLDSLLAAASSYALALGKSRVTSDLLLIAAIEALPHHLVKIASSHGATRDSLLRRLVSNRKFSIPPSTSSAVNYADTTQVDAKTMTIETEIPLHRSVAAALTWAGIEARYENRQAVTDTDILIGLIRNEQSRASQALGYLGINVIEVRDAIMYINEVDPSEDESRAVETSSRHDQPLTRPLSSGARMVLREAHSEAVAEGGFGETSAKHVLLGLLKLSSGPTAIFLESIGLDYELVRRSLEAIEETLPSDVFASDD